MQNKRDISELNSIMEALFIELTKNKLSISEELSLVINLYFYTAKRWLEILEENGASAEMLDEFLSACKQAVLFAYENFLSQIQKK